MEEATLKTGLGTGKIKYQRAQITIPTLTAAGVMTDATVALDGNFDRCIGICIQDQGILASESVGIGLLGDNDTIIDIVNANLLVPSTAVPMNARFMPVNFQAKNRQYTIRNMPFAAIGGSDCVFDVVFMLITDPKQ